MGVPLEFRLNTDQILLTLNMGIVKRTLRTKLTSFNLHQIAQYVVLQEKVEIIEEVIDGSDRTAEDFSEMARDFQGVNEDPQGVPDDGKGTNEIGSASDGQTAATTATHRNPQNTIGKFQKFDVNLHSFFWQHIQQFMSLQIQRRVVCASEVTSSTNQAFCVQLFENSMTQVQFFLK